MKFVKLSLSNDTASKTIAEINDDQFQQLSADTVVPAKKISNGNKILLKFYQRFPEL